MTHDDVDRFASWLRGRGYSPRTVREYIKWARRLVSWCAERGLAVDELSPYQIAEWGDSLPASRSSRKQAHTTLKHVVAWRGLPDSYHLAMPVPRKPRRKQSKALSDEEARQLRDTAVEFGGRPGIATLCGLYLAARASEIAGLRWDGWDHDRGRFRWWRSKLLDWHEVPVHPDLAEQLTAYRHTDPSESPYLFPSPQGGWPPCSVCRRDDVDEIDAAIAAGTTQRALARDKLGKDQWSPLGRHVREGHVWRERRLDRPVNAGHVHPQTIWQWVTDMAREAGISHVYPHRLRDTALTIVNDATGNLRAAQEIAGHSDPEVTAGYTRATDRMLADAVRAFDSYRGDSEPEPSTDVEPLVSPARPEDHPLTLRAVYTDVDRFQTKQQDGRSAFTLERDGAFDLLPDTAHGVCGCGEASQALDTWQQARQWCRDHRAELGLERQSSLPEDVQLRA